MNKIISGLLFVMILTYSCKKEMTSHFSDQPDSSSGDSANVQLLNVAGYGSSTCLWDPAGYHSATEYI